MVDLTKIVFVINEKHDLNARKKCYIFFVCFTFYILFSCNKCWCINSELWLCNMSKLEMGLIQLYCWNFHPSKVRKSPWFICCHFIPRTFLYFIFAPSFSLLLISAYISSEKGPKPAVGWAREALAAPRTLKNRTSVEISRELLYCGLASFSSLWSLSLSNCGSRHHTISLTLVFSSSPQAAYVVFRSDVMLNCQLEI